MYCWYRNTAISSRSKYREVPGSSGNIHENLRFWPKQVNRLVPKKKKKKNRFSATPSFHCSLGISDHRRQVFNVASVYSIVPAASSSSSRLLYPNVASLLLMNFLITMPLSFFFFLFRLCLFYYLFFN